MQNETQNQNIDTQEVKQEAPVRTETPQNNQDIGAQDQSMFEAAPEPSVPNMEAQETVDQVPPLGMAADSNPIPEYVLMDPFTSQESPQVVMDPYRSPDDLVGSDPAMPTDPKVTMNPEDLFGTGQDWDPSSWGGGGSDVPDPAATTGIIVDPVPTDPTNTGIIPPWLQEPSNPLPTESEYHDGDDCGWSSDQDATPGGYDGSGIAGGLDLDGDGVFDQIENNPDMSDKVYAYDEDAYEDAEDTLEDLRDALRDGDEEERTEALKELQGYLRGFDKGAEDEENDFHNHGDPEEVPNTADKEPMDAPDPSGAAVGAGAVGEANGLGEDIDEALGIDGAGKVLGDVANGDFDGALDAATGLTGGAIDDALGIEGAGEVLDGVFEGDWDKVTDALPDLVDEGVEEYFGIEGAGEAFEDILEGDWDQLGDHIGEAAGNFVGNYFGGPVGAEIGGEIGEWLGDGVGDAVTEEVGDIGTHIENGDYDELAGDTLALGAGAVGGLIFGEDGAAVGQEIGEAVGDTASEFVEGVGEVAEDVGEAVEDFFDSLW